MATKDGIKDQVATKDGIKDQVATKDGTQEDEDDTMIINESKTKRAGRDWT